VKKFLSTIEGIFREGVLILGKLLPLAGLFPGILPGAGVVLNGIQLALTEIINVSSIINTPGQGAARLTAAAPRIAALFTTAVDGLGLKVSKDGEARAATALTNITSNLADFLDACEKK
jgi:hypothetical protein